MLIGTTELKFDKRNNSNVYVVGATGTGKTRLYIHTNVGQEKEKNIIVIESMKKETYYFTHQMKVEQGYQVLRLDLLSPYFHERLQELLSCHPQQKFILYIHVDVVGSTYEERGNEFKICFESSSNNHLYKQCKCIWMSMTCIRFHI
ncbi:type IV secretory system conjugative DNA transfer family protein [Bacillus cereus]